MAAPRPLAVFVVVVLLTSLPPAAEGLRLSQWNTLVSLSHSLLTRVANARAARDDLAGADRVRKIADKFSILGGSGGGIWSLGRDFAWNYAWRGGAVPTAEISRATSRLLEALAEACRIESAAERRRWALRNHRHLVDLADSLFESLLRTFSRSGPLREMVLRCILIFLQCRRTGALKLKNLHHLLIAPVTHPNPTPGEGLIAINIALCDPAIHFQLLL
ncbi:hypothetical protein OPV22_031546 [Ensete ventricosum]|uniref:Uncharacterized protein n=1 Tax=Ensete ventricosum TaxID=4639 RepID=A0AAV8P0L9_ENSVE|nr:hypothetical protein OPV22_031546 [Ensete ventricosum]